MNKFSIQAAILFTVTVYISCASDEGYTEEIMNWRQEQVEELTARIGWASLTGLYWLDDRTTWIGEDKDSGSFQVNKDGMDTIGSIVLQGTNLTFTSFNDKMVNNGLERIKHCELLTDKSGVPSLLSYQQYYWTVLDRNSKFGLRVWDTTHIGRTKYSQLEYYDIDKRFKVDAVFEPFDVPKKKALKNILGMDIEQTIPGLLTFELSGNTYHLEPIDTGTSEYFLIFADETTGGETYGGGRYLYCRKPDPNNKTVIDFNKAFTPPCGFTEYATCLLPSKENNLLVEILAGEKYLESH